MRMLPGTRRGPTMHPNHRSAHETSPAPQNDRPTVTFGEVPSAVFVVESEMEPYAHRRVVKVSVARFATFTLP
jgi:hypothetical protein